MGRKTEAKKKINEIEKKIPHLFYFLELKAIPAILLFINHRHILFIRNTSILCDYFSKEVSTACNPKRLRIVILVLPSKGCA